MATKRAEQRKLQMSVSMGQALYDAVRDVAHIEGVHMTEIAARAIIEYLQRHYPERAAEAVR